MVSNSSEVISSTPESSCEIVSELSYSYDNQFSFAAESLKGVAEIDRELI